jgi:hypothetical protein
MADPINRKLSSRAVLKADMEEFINRELVPVVERLRLALSSILGMQKSGEGDPEGVVEAPVGSIYQRTDGGAGSSLYVKETGGSTSAGWAAK